MSDSKNVTKRMSPIVIEELNRHNKPTKREKAIKIDSKSKTMFDSTYSIVNKNEDE